MISGLNTNFQLTRQVASDILDVMTISVCLQAKLASGNKKPLVKTEFLLVCNWLATVSVEC